MRKLILIKVAGAILLMLCLVMCRQHTESCKCVSCIDTLSVSTPQDAIARLLAGNERYVNEKSIYPRTGIDRVTETAPHQAPFAAVVGCSDSRVPVELIFDQGIGDIFV